MAEKYKQFVIGLRAQLENITSNELLKNIMCGKSDLGVDEHFANDGVLIVNTALGTLKKAGDAFGQFLIMHLQNGTFRRPGTEDTRTPHFMFIDEYKRYINPQVEIFLSLAASYKVSGILASQSLGQLEVEAGDISPRAMKQAIMTNCRNKLCFNGIGFRDAQEFADEFGKDKIVMRQSTYKHLIFLPNLFPDSYRDTESEEYRFDPTDIMDNLPKYSFIHKIMYEAAMQKPSLARGNLVPADWKEKKEWEDNRLRVRLHNGLKKAGAGTIAQLKRISNAGRSMQQHTVQPANHVSMKRTVGNWDVRQTEETKHVSNRIEEESPSTPVQQEPPTVAVQEETQDAPINDINLEQEPSSPVVSPLDYPPEQEKREEPVQSSLDGEQGTSQKQEIEQKNKPVTVKPKASSDGFFGIRKSFSIERGFLYKSILKKFKTNLKRRDLQWQKN
ncbi:TraM recognition domain-containing protein [Virgibacillus sediminis]|uniref:TraM recognition domain-containing protein n=1 Tax=Virgibacillus sediminis TaxID=202260 RepID=A0ABV7AAN5_9BACI